MGTLIDFGPDEIQLCEIQSACLGNGSIVSELLERCFDDCVRERFRTQSQGIWSALVHNFNIEVRNKALDRTFGQVMR